MDTPSTITPATPRKKMPAEVFLKIWRNNFEVGQTEWRGFVRYDKIDGIRRTILTNIEIEGNILIENTNDPLLYLVLSNCHLQDCKFKGAKLRTVFIDDKSKTGNFFIKNATIKYFFIKNSTVGNFLIENSTNNSIQIKNSTTGNFEIYGSPFGDLMIEEGSTGGRLRIFNSEMSRLSVLNSKLAEIQLWNNEIQRVWVRDNSFISYIRFLFHPQKPTHLIFEKSTIPFFDFKNTVLPEFNTIMVRDCKINKLDLESFCNYGSVFFDGVTTISKWKDFKSLKRKDWEPARKDGKYKTIKLGQKSDRPPTLRFIDSDLGKIQFINCDLREFDRFEFSNTKMLDVFVAGSQMPDASSFCLPGKKVSKSIKKRTCFDKVAKFIHRKQRLISIVFKRGVKPIRYIKDSTSAEQKRLAYGQFKRIYETQGDLAGSLRYLAYEMEAYREQLIQEKTRPRFSKKWWCKKKAWDNRGERATLWLNKNSTNYGNNWLRGLAMTLITMSICFTFFCWMLGYWFGDDWELFGELSSYAPHYLNPLRDLDSVSLIKESEPKIPIVWYARLWDFISRIIVAYFAYQTIQAFRKLGKSSG